jgi:hypothetical protein
MFNQTNFFYQFKHYDAGQIWFFLFRSCCDAVKRAHSENSGTVAMTATSSLNTQGNM